MIAARLAYYDLKRISRHSVLRMLLLALPLAAALLRAVFAESSFAPVCAWACPLVCIATICAVLGTRHAMDRMTGLLDGLRSSPISDSGILASRFVAGGIILAVQMAVMFVIPALWPF